MLRLVSETFTLEDLGSFLESALSDISTQKSDTEALSASDCSMFFALCEA